MRPIGGRIANGQWVAYGTDGFIDWLTTLHGDPAVFLRVYEHLMDRVNRLELAGPRVDNIRLIRKLHDHNGLGEAKYKDGSGAYRAFFKFGSLNGTKVVIFADGDRKTSDNFSVSRFLRAERLVDEAFDVFGVQHSKEW